MPTAVVDTSTDGATVVAAPTGGRAIYILGLNLTANGAVTVSLKSGANTVWKTYAMADPNVKGGIVVPFDLNRDMPLDANTALTIGLSAVVAVAGTVDYCIR